MGSDDQFQLPKIDFTGLALSATGTDRWAATRARVMEALEAYGCFEAGYDDLTPEIQDAIFGKPMEDVFALPLEFKEKNVSNKPAHGYINTHRGYETLFIDNASEPQGLDNFMDLMWGDKGNQNFRGAVAPFTQQLRKLGLIIRRMILEGLGVEKYFDEFVNASVDVLRMSKYAQTDPAFRTTLPAHTDATILSIVCQREVQGLELQLKDGRWFAPPPNTISIMTGQTLWAWSNGRMEPIWHRVMPAGDETRYSALYFVLPRDGHIVKAPEELVDDEHPLQFRPFEYVEYIKFAFSDATAKTGCCLEDYCGVQQATAQENVAA